MEIHFKNYLFKAGDFGVNSLGGIYNPSVIATKNGFKGIARVEADYEAYKGKFYEQNVFPTMFDYDPRTHTASNPKPLFCSTFDIAQSRIEDFRLFVDNSSEDLKFTHTFIDTTDGRLKVKQQISFINSQFEVNQVENLLLVPNYNLSSLNYIEKNWGVIIQGEKRYYIYSVDPWIVLEEKDKVHNIAVLEAVKKVPTPLTKSLFPDCKLLSLSTHPIDFDDKNYLVFVHFKEHNHSWLYRQIAVLVDKQNLLPVAYTPNTFLFSWFNFSQHNSVIYISSCIKFQDKIQLFGGIGDSHSGVWEIEINELLNNMIKI